MQIVGRINIETYRCIAEDITTEEVVITDERIEHIRARHPGDYERLKPFLAEAVCSPDYILRDSERTGLVLKRIEKENIRFQMVLRVHTSADTATFKNSILSAWRISESRWDSYVRNKIILYRKE